MKLVMAIAAGIALLPMAARGSVPFKPGEKTSFALTYFGATAGIFTVEVLPSTKEGAKTWHEFSATARTDAIFSLFYHLKNVYRSTVDASAGVPKKFQITLDETRQWGTTTQEFDHGKKKVRFSDRREEKKKGKIEKDFTKDIPPGTQDVVSAFFHLRAQPLEVGKQFEIPVFIGEEICLLRFTVVEEEKLSTKIGDVPSFVLRPTLLKDGQVKEIPETLIWIAKEHDRALLKVKAKVKIGSIIAYLREFEPGKPEPKALPGGKPEPKALPEKVVK